MELKKGPIDNNQEFDNSSYYQSNDPFNPTNGIQDPFGPDGTSDYYSEQGTYDPSQNPYNQLDTAESVNPYVQAGYGRVDLNDGYYDEEAAAPGIDTMGMAAKTVGMTSGIGNMLGNIGSGLGGNDSDDSYHHHRRRYYGRRGYYGGYGSRYPGRHGYRGGNVGAAAAVPVSEAFINEVLVSSFLYMFIALLISGISGLIIAANPGLYMPIIESGRLGIIIITVVEIVLVLLCTSVIQTDNFWLSAVLFFSFAAVNGVTFAIIFLVFQLSSIVTVFFMTSVVFAVMAFYGATTKKDLTGWGPILLGTLIAIVLGSIVNIVLGNTMLDMCITVIGVVLFSIFTAYDVNKISKMSRMNTGLSANVLGMYGAMELYLDFINLFVKLLRLFGKKK